ncbi:probable ADP-ribosylation factor GTPase-activating protein AGD14 [Vigna unguiculata]|uniref:probable ADP-ribosylation factor GTPase-activating protein AGD14 n=1 Tax=Vigna unguiculata TaxID=3917 RepID=UPI0010165EE4|nr:probable ADP-ribosylation factor GTPase-activating protein AGD14 [Vigna unguiculata]
MRSQKTEEERIEKIIRSLLKLPENKRCINCNLLGPQYVCTTFSTFVCTNCSGIHREFTHRVKSVSMAKFSPEEVSALQAGGNERANQIFLKEWDPLRNSKPDSSNIQKLREFIKFVYVERKYTGESSTSTLSRIRLSEKEPKRSGSFRLEFRTPHSSPGPTPRSDDKNLRYLYDESRSPRYAQRYSRNGGQIRSPIQIEVVDDRYKDDERRNRRLANIEAKMKKNSSDDLKKVENPQLPVIAAPLGDVSKEKAQPLQIKPPGGKVSVEKKPSEQKNNNPETPPPPIAQPNENNWAIFEASTEDNVPKTPPNTRTSYPSTEKAPSTKNPIDLLLSELSGPVTPMNGGMPQVPSSVNNDPTTTTVQNAITWDFPPTSAGKTTASSNNTSVWPCTSTPATEPAQPSNEAPPHTEVCHAHNPSSVQYLPSVSVGFSSTTQPSNSSVIDVASNNKPSVTPSEKDPSWSFTEQPSQTTSNPTQETKSDPSKVENKASGRHEIPENLFTPSYLSGQAPLPNWQNVQPSGMGYGMQYYHNAVPPSAISNSPMSMNPFDLTDSRNLTHVSSLPSITSVRGAPQALSSPRTALMHTASMGSLVSQSPSYTSPVMGVYFDQVDNQQKPPRPQRAESFNGDITSFGSVDPLQHSNRTFTTCKSSISLSNARGNPFD